MAFRKTYDLETPEARKKLCEQFQTDIRAAKKHWEKDFKRMIEDMEICRKGAPKKWGSSANYRVNITQRMVRQKAAKLYAKNPRAVAKRRQRMEHKYWDGSDQQLMEILQRADQGDPIAMMYLQDIMQAEQRKKMLDKVGKTLVICMEYFTREQEPKFKHQMKRAVYSAIQTGVGYIKLGFQREMELTPENSAVLADYAKQLRHIQTLMTELQDEDSGEDPELSSKAEELKHAMKALQEKEQVIVREGLTFDYVAPTSIIPDTGCSSILSWMDSSWLTEEIFMTPDDIKEYFNVDLQSGGDYNTYKTSQAAYKRNPNSEIRGKRDDMACVWVLQHKPSGMVYTMCDGFEDFLEEPELPQVELERFFNVYAIITNEMEHSGEIFPESDVRIMLPQQMEMNRAREALRQHRKANRPGYITPHGLLSDEDKGKLTTHEDNEVVELQGVDPGRDLKTVLQQIPKQQIDPNLYETNGIMQDVFLSMGAQEATFGGTSNATATEAAIAESSQAGAAEAETDALNDFLSNLFQDAGKVLLMELDEETVMEIAGPGAVWPSLSRAEIAQELLLDIVAGSNGKPNQAARKSALQQLLPILMQVPGVTPGWIAKQVVEAIDEGIDLEEALAAGLPSIQMMNQISGQAQQGAGDDPNAQGGEGANNAPRPPEQGGTQAPMGGNNIMEFLPGAAPAA